MSDTDIEKAAEELSTIIPDAVCSDVDLVLFTNGERVSPEVMEVLSKYELTLYPIGLIEYTHKELTDLSGKPLSATYTAGK